MRSLAATATIVLLVAAASVCAAGCGSVGGTENAHGAERMAPIPVIPTAHSNPSRPIDLVLPDCSHSFRQHSERLVPEMTAVALDSAAQRRVLRAACFAGSPLQNLEWTLQVDFGDLSESNKSLTERVNQARALGLRGKFEKIIHDTPRKAPGSGQLEVLELAAQTPGVGRVFMFTDARIFEPNGVVVGSLSRAEVKETVERWAPRLRGLKGVELFFVGGGLGAPSARSVRNARMLFGDLARQVGASFSWTRSLPLEL
jgi:hypothetical protein